MQMLNLNIMDDILFLRVCFCVCMLAYVYEYRVDWLSMKFLIVIIC